MHDSATLTTERRVKQTKTYVTLELIFTRVEKPFLQRARKISIFGFGGASEKSHRQYINKWV